MDELVLGAVTGAAVVGAAVVGVVAAAVTGAAVTTALPGTYVNVYLGSAAPEHVLAPL
jgi:hypothetical protein